MTEHKPKVDYTDPIPDEFIDILCRGSDSQIDECLKPRLEALRNRPAYEARDELLGIIWDARYCSLTSGFTLQALDFAWRHMCGGTDEEHQMFSEMLKVDVPGVRNKLKLQSINDDYGK